MDELIRKMDELIEAINNNNAPTWLTWVGIFVPIIISIAVIVQAAVQAKNNKKFQKYISDREVTVQMHGEFLKIYDAFCSALDAVGKAKDNISQMFLNHNVAFQWANELLDERKNICQAMNRARLLLPSDDELFFNTLRTIFHKYQNLTEHVANFIAFGTAEYYRTQTWEKISQTYQIPRNDILLISNPSAYQDFLKLYSNQDTDAINEELNEIISLFDYEKFDKYFEKYVRIELR